MDVYQTIRSAIQDRKQVVATYQGHVREMCPHVIGYGPTGIAQALFFQFAGGSSRGLPPGGMWRCLRLADLSDVETRNGEWHTGPRHSQPQTCVRQVDLEVDY